MKTFPQSLKINKVIVNISDDNSKALIDLYESLETNRLLGYSSNLYHETKELTQRCSYLLSVELVDKHEGLVDELNTNIVSLCHKFRQQEAVILKWRQTNRWYNK